MDGDMGAQDPTEVLLSLDVLLSKMDELKGSLDHAAQASVGAVISQGLQALDAKLTAMDAQVRQLIGQRQQAPPTRVLARWQTVAALVLVGILGGGVGCYVASLRERQRAQAMVKATVKATILELGQPPQLAPQKGKR